MQLLQQVNADSFEKNYRCLGHGLKICILFEYNPHKMKVPPTVLCQLSLNFNIHSVFAMV